MAAVTFAPFFVVNGRARQAFAHQKMRLFSNNNRQLRKLEGRLQRIESALAHINHQPVAPVGAELIASAASSQAQTLEAMGGFIKLVSDIAAERAAVALGRRGGRKSAKDRARDARGRMLPRSTKSSCRLCANPLLSDPALDELTEHFKHKGTVEAGTEAPNRHSIDEVIYTEVETPGPARPRPQPEYPLPHVDISAGDQADRPGDDTAPGQYQNGHSA